MLKVLLVADKKNWSYHWIAQAIKNHAEGSGLVLDLAFMKQDEQELKSIHKEYDLVFFLGWQLLYEKKNRFLGRGWTLKRKHRFIEDSRVLTGIHSHMAWDGEETQPDREVLPPPVLVEALSKVRGVNAVSARLTRVFQKAGLEGVTYTPNGINEESFSPGESLGLHSDRLVFGMTGASKHAELKGIPQILEPLGRLPWLELRMATRETNHLSHEEMPDFYRGLDVYLCASASEGFSMSVLEAAATGLPVVSTRVGGCEDLIEDGVNGFLVDRHLAPMEERLKELHENRELLRSMGAKVRKSVLEKWTWAKRAPAWKDFITKR